MKSISLLIIALCFYGPLFAASLPDKQPIYTEMDAVVDSTPNISEKDAKAADKLIEKGIKEHDKQKYEKAIDLYKQALAKNPLSSIGYYELSMTQYSLQQLEEAYKNAVRAEALNPNLEGAYIIIANIEDDAGFPDKAIQTYDRLISIEPKSFMAWLNKGITLLKTEKFSAAEECFKKASELDGRHPSPYYFLMLSSSMQGYSYDEEMYIEKFLEVGKNDRRLPIVESRKKELKASNIYLEENPSSFDLFEQLLRLTWRQTKHRESYPAERGYRRSLKEERDVAETMITYADENKDELVDRADIDRLKLIAAAGLLDARNYLLLKEHLGTEDLAWGAKNMDKIHAYEEWLKQNP
jgi:tetratricopeptide (TPR) repeat protein